MITKKRFSVKALLLAMLCPLFTLQAADYGYGLPSKIEDGNILHCFSWPIKNIREELPNIAAAGFGSIQISPMQRPDINEGWTWYTIYLPYDYHAFSSPGMGSREDLRALCSEAKEYGIKIIVDVVLNHVNKTEPYYNPWFKSDQDRYRYWGKEGRDINYDDRKSVTHDPLGDYVELNTENWDVVDRAKAYIEELKELGVEGIRYDAAKHIELPSETYVGQGGIWPAVTGVQPLFHYGEIVGNCYNGGDDAIREYAQYIWVPNNEYTTWAARENGGIPTAHQGARADMTGSHLIYWAESHDDYSNDEWSERVNQGVIDRAYCAYACRNVPAALYYSRPRARGKENIKIEKGSTSYMGKHIREVNKFRNAMTGKAEYFTHSNGVVSVTRQNGGAVIIAKGSDQDVSIANGGGYCPTGSYTDRVSGNPFNVTATTITGKVGPTGVAVLYRDQDYKDTPVPNEVTITGTETFNVAYSGNFSNGKNYIHYWKNGQNGSGTTWPGVPMKRAKGDDGKYYWCYNVPPGMDRVIFNNGYGADDADNCGMQTGDLTLNSNFVMDNGGATFVQVKFTTGTFEQEPVFNPATDKTVTIDGDYNVAFSGSFNHVYYWSNANGSDKAEHQWPGVAMTQATGDDGNDYWCYKVPAGTTGIIFNNGDTNNIEQTGDLRYSGVKVMSESGPTEVNVLFKVNGEVVTPDKVVIYGDYNVAYTGDKDYVYAYRDGSGTIGNEWPGQKMSTAVGDNGHTYKVAKIGDATTHVIFNNGNTNDMVQTDDLGFTRDYIMDDLGATPTPVEFRAPEVSDVYVYVDGWRNEANVYCYIFNTDNTFNAGWPGVKMQIDDKTGYWYYQVPKGYENGSVVVNKGDGKEQFPEQNAGGLALNGSSKVLHINGYKWETPGEDIKPDPTPKPGEAEEPEALDVIAEYPSNSPAYCYFYDNASWKGVNVWAWNSQGNCTSANNFPGEKLSSTLQTNLYIWKAQPNKNPSEVIFSKSSDSNTRAGGDLAFKNAAVYTPSGKYFGGECLVGYFPEKLYMQGTFPGHSWDPSYHDIVLTRICDEGIYIATGVELDEDEETGRASFSFSRTYSNNSDWDSGLNTQDRYGAYTKDLPISPNTLGRIMQYNGNSDAGDCKSWTIESGTYDFIVDLYNMTVTVLEPQSAPSVEAIQLAEVQKQYAANTIKTYDYITYPAVNGKAKGVKVSGDNVTVTENVSVSDDIYHDAGNVLFTEKALVITTFNGTASYNLEPKTASIGKLSGNSNKFYGIVALDNLEENTISSKVNYYYPLVEKYDVNATITNKIPMQTPAGSCTVKLAVPEPCLIHAGVDVTRSSRTMKFTYEGIDFNANYNIATASVEIAPSNITDGLDEVAGRVYSVRADGKNITGTKYNGDVISPADLLDGSFSLPELTLHTYEPDVDATGRWNETISPNLAASFTMDYKAPIINSCKVTNVNIEKQPVTINGGTQQHLIETTTLALDVTTEYNEMTVKNSNNDDINTLELSHSAQGDWYLAEFYRNGEKLRTAIVEGLNGAREFKIVYDHGQVTPELIERVYGDGGLWIDKIGGYELTVSVSTLYPFAQATSAVSYNSMRRAQGNNTTSAIIETNASTKAVNVEGATLTGIAGIFDTADDNAEYYNLQGIRVGRPDTPGVYVMRRANGSARKIVVK